MKKLLYASVSLLFLGLCCSENVRAMEDMTVSITEDAQNNKKAAAGMWAYLENSGVLDFIQKHNLEARAAAAVIASALGGFVWYAAKKMARVPTARTAQAGAITQVAARKMIDAVADTSAIEEAARATGSGLVEVERISAGNVEDKFVNPLLAQLEGAIKTLRHVETPLPAGGPAIPFGAVPALGGGWR